MGIVFQELGWLETDWLTGGWLTGGMSAKLPMQFDLNIYNTTQIRFLYLFDTDGLTLNNVTASSEAVGFPVNNVKTNFLIQRWQSTGVSSEWLLFDMGRARAVDTFAIINHNLTSSAVVRMQLNDTTDFSAPAIDELLTWGLKNIVYIAPEVPDAYRYLRLTVEDPTNPDASIRIGRVVGGTSLVFSEEENIRQDLRKGGQIFKDEIETEGFATVSNLRIETDFIEVNFESMQIGLNNYQQLVSMFRTVHNIKPFLMVADPQSPREFHVFGSLAERPEESHNYDAEDYISLTMRVQEKM